MTPTGLTYPFLKNKPTKKIYKIHVLKIKFKKNIFPVKLLSFTYFLDPSITKEKKKSTRKFSEAHLKFYVSINFSCKNSKD